MNIINVNENTWIIEDDNVRCFLLEGEKSAALIDTGMKLENIKEMVESLTNKEILLLNTHADRDHVGGNNQFDKVYIGVHELAYYQKTNSNKEIIPLYDNDIIDLGNRKLEVINLPGHTPGSIAFNDINNSVLISGDSIQRNGRVFMFGEQRNKIAYVSSLQRLNKRKDDFKEIWPSHADLPLDNSYIEKCCKDMIDLLDNKLPYTKEERFGTVIRTYQGKENIYLCDD